MAPDQIWPRGLAMPCPAMSGAEPCTGSNIEGPYNGRVAALRVDVGRRRHAGGRPSHSTAPAPAADFVAIMVGVMKAPSRFYCGPDRTGAMTASLNLCGLLIKK